MGNLNQIIIMDIIKTQFTIPTRKMYGTENRNRKEYMNTEYRKQRKRIEK
ncbi:hypothetical protein PIROE2DRAFT_9414 [Piromyces sp. E2]|nr:hypothetical protein PIROE2DRAFT_9414 [Piromyces sp. E2]|eukprot:OUM63954.1 hypothetical protein PIROE2DRAFT_9414 [Piromyces sp. E2]